MESFLVVCPGCGKENDNDQEYCVRCALKITTEIKEIQYQELIKKRQEEQEKKDVFRKKLESQKSDVLKIKLEEFKKVPKLISCPDCERDISIRAVTCVHCGRPMDDNPFSGLSLKSEETAFDVSKIKELEKEIASIDSTIQKQFVESDKESESIRVPSCLHCGSENFERTSMSKKVGMALLGGIYTTGTIGKTFRCLDCGYRW